MRQDRPGFSPAVWNFPEGRVIVIAPTCHPRTGFTKRWTSQRKKGSWRKAGVLSVNHVVWSVACTLDSGNISIATKSHIVITNVHQLATNVDKWLTQFPDDFFDTMTES